MISSRPISRRVALGGIAVAGAAALDAFVVEPHWLDVSLHDVVVPGFPRSLDGFRMAQVTDAHLKSIGTVEEAVVSAVTEHDVHLVALTGDLVDSVDDLKVLRVLLGELGSTRATLIGTLGNWEHWGRIPSEDLLKTYAAAGGRLLVNETYAVPGGVRVFATDDATGGRPEFTMERGKSKQPQVLLTHSPAALDEYPAEADTMALSLAGHTHGGQVRLGPGLVPFLPSGCGRFVAGWYDTPAGRAYVSRGTGTSILPVRFTCRPELPIFTFRQA